MDGARRRPRISLVGLDVDGTVLDGEQRLSPRVRDAVRAVAAAGVHVVLATGRNLGGVLPVLEALGLREGWVVCTNGAVVARVAPDLPGGREIVETVTFEAAPVLGRLLHDAPDVTVAVEDARGELLLSAPFPPGQLSGVCRVLPVARLGVRTPRIIVQVSDGYRRRVLDAVAAVGLPGVTCDPGWLAWIDVVPAGVSKATGLEVVRRRLGVDRSETLVAGDWPNDLGMFAWAGWAVAMGQAPDEVRAAADEVTGTVLQHGLAPVLEDLVARPGSPGDPG